MLDVSSGPLITVTAAFVFWGANRATGGTFGLGFHALPVVLGHMGLLGSLWVIYFSKDLVALETMDFCVGTFGVVILEFFASPSSMLLRLTC